MNATQKRYWAIGASSVIIGGLLSLFVYGLFFADDPKQIPTTLLEKPAPSFSLTTMDSKPLTSGDLKGHPLVVNFWASWCVPCRQEAVELEQAWQEFGPAGLRIVGIAVGDKELSVRSFVERYSMTFPVAQDTEKGDILLEYGVTGIPETFLISPDGIIKKKFYGAITYKDVASFFQSYIL